MGQCLLCISVNDYNDMNTELYTLRNELNELTKIVTSELNEQTRTQYMYINEISVLKNKINEIDDDVFEFKKHVYSKLTPSFDNTINKTM